MGLQFYKQREKISKAELLKYQEEQMNSELEDYEDDDEDDREGEPDI